MYGGSFTLPLQPGFGLGVSVVLAGHGSRISGDSGAWLKSKSFVRSPSNDRLSRTLGRESGRPSVAGSRRAPPRKSSSMNLRYASNDTVWESISPRRAYGLITRPGTRIP